MEINKQLHDLVESTITSLGYELYELDAFRSGSKLVLRVYIDHEDGVGVDDCSKISRELGTALDLEDPIAEAYQLEVSSPGVDRPLKKTRDFLRNINRILKVSLAEPVQDQKVWSGELLSADDDQIIIKTGEDDITIDRENILNARVELQF